jgi:hypothetical protein
LRLLLVLWRDETKEEFALAAVEVKTSDGDHLSNGPARHADAVKQIEHTLEALADGLGAAASAQSSPLSIPRCEVFKQTLVKASLARSSDAGVDRTNRRRFGAWLAALFPQGDSPAPTVRLSGCVVSVMLRRAASGVEEKLAAAPWPLFHRELGEPDVEALLAWEAGKESPPPASASVTAASDRDAASTIPSTQPVEPAKTVSQPWTPRQPIPNCQRAGKRRRLCAYARSRDGQGMASSRQPIGDDRAISDR